MLQQAKKDLIGIGQSLLGIHTGLEKKKKKKKKKSSYFCEQIAPLLT